MNSKVLVAGIIGGIVAFLLGWLVYGILLMDFMAGQAGSATGVSKEMPDMLPLVLGNLFWGLAYAYIFGTWANIKTFSGGAMGGAIVGGLFAAAFDLIMLGTTNIMTPTGAIVDVIASIVMSAVVGGVIGWWLGRGSAA
ncbi:MAG TPA: hypothetical protein PKC40_04355 [Saprospiraceae bacterium]|nr:hypothetical protein [Saprospiraceae bacterium]